MLLELSMLCRLELISNIHSQRYLIINEVCDEQADEVADTTNLHGEYGLRGCKQQNELDSTRYVVCIKLFNALLILSLDDCCLVFLITNIYKWMQKLFASILFVYVLAEYTS